jgi:hypothetical protein
MAISKLKTPNLLDDLVLNFDPFALNGLDELNPASSSIQGTPGVQDPAGDQPAGAQVTGVVVPAAADTGHHDAPPVTLFRIELPAATAHQEDDGPPVGPPSVAGTPEPAPEDPGPQGPPPPVADPNFNEVAPQEPDPGPAPTVQENASTSPQSVGVAHGISVSDQNPFGLPGDSSVTSGDDAAALHAHEAGWFVI